jgi:hypothetical protein
LYDKKSRWLLLAFLTMLALMIVLSLYFAPLYVFKTMHDYGLRGLSSFWSVGENSRAEAKFGYPLSAEIGRVQHIFDRQEKYLISVFVCCNREN